MMGGGGFMRLYIWSRNGDYGDMGSGTDMDTLVMELG